jgi:hypothetical protein
VADERYEPNRPDVVDESVDGEVLIVHLGTGAYYSARGSGDLVWQLLAGGATFAEAASALGATPDAVERFAATLVAEGLLRLRNGRAPAVPVISAPPVFDEPVLEKYTDMQELLVLDPIHEVEEAGWPRARGAAAGD